MTSLEVSFGGRTFVGAANPSNWWLLHGGLEGWDESADSRYQAENIPGQHGSFYPAEQLLSGREIVFTGAHSAVSQEVAESDVLTWAASLTPRMDLTFEVKDASGVKSARVFVRGRPKIRRADYETTEFQIVFHAPDPRKYGPTRTVSTKPGGTETFDGLQFPLFEDGYLDFGEFNVAGGFVLSNAGTADSWPVFRVRGDIDASGFLIQSGTDQLRFEAAVPLGKELVLSPYAGGRAILGGVDVSPALTIANWSSVQSGEARQYAFSVPGAAGDSARLDAEIRDAWF